MPPIDITTAPMKNPIATWLWLSPGGEPFAEQEDAEHRR